MGKNISNLKIHFLQHRFHPDGVQWMKKRWKNNYLTNLKVRDGFT